MKEIPKGGVKSLEFTILPETNISQDKTSQMEEYNNQFPLAIFKIILCHLWSYDANVRYMCEITKGLKVVNTHLFKLNALFLDLYPSL